jgi:hypothetical protein
MNGQAVCNDTGQPASDGTSCGVNEVCKGGSCMPCTANVVCNPGGNPCQTGLTDCSMGTQTCAPKGNVMDGTSCGTNQVCQAGACTCSGGLTSCSGTCVNLQNSGSDCGACGHSCLGGACAGGQCQPVTLGTLTGRLAVDATNVYVASGQHIFSCSINGACGAGTVIYTVSNNLNGLEAVVTPLPPSPYSPFVYTAELGSDCSFSFFAQIKKSNNMATGVADSVLVSPNALAFDAVNSWVYILDWFPGELYRVKPDGSQQSVVLSGIGVGNAYEIAVDSTNVYVPEYQKGNILYSSLTTPALQVAMNGLANPSGVYSSGSTVWATAVGATPGTGAIYTCPINTNCGTPTPVAAAQDGPGDIVVDASNAYWGNNQTATIMRCAIGGCGGNPTPIASGTGTYVSLAQDSVAIYWTDKSGLYKVAK